MQIKKNVLLLSLIFLGVLPLGYGIPPNGPDDVINSYLGEYRNAGNVLSYRNAFDQIITLKSGKFHGKNPRYRNNEERYMGLGLVVLAVASDRLEDYFNADGNPNPATYSFNPLDLEDEGRNAMIASFLEKCSENNDNWNVLNPRQKENEVDNLQTRLGQYRHTELQLQALYTRYLECPEAERTGARALSLKTKVLKRLLPVALTDPDSRSVANKNIYSLFEACRACMRTSWLSNPRTAHKSRFYFAILDNQYLGDDHKRQVIPERSFFLQSTIETTVIPAPDLGDIEGTIGEFSKQIDMLYIKIREGFRGISHNFRDLD